MLAMSSSTRIRLGLHRLGVFFFWILLGLKPGFFWWYCVMWVVFFFYYYYFFLFSDDDGLMSVALVGC